MCETKTILVSLSLILPVAASFCINQAHTVNRVAHHSGIKSQSPGENQYKKFCLNGGDGYYLVDGCIVGCNYSWLYGAK